MKKLQILIPQYNETEEIIKPLLDSIELQQNVDLKNDISVIICNGGSNIHLNKEFLDKYSFDIEYYINSQETVSKTRNACLDHATAEYVMFCDADDIFFNMCGLWVILRECSIGFDSLVSMFREESRHPQTKEVVYINHEMDSTFVHGKVHRRKYLLENNIRWDDNLSIHEDSYFNILCQKLSQNVKYCSTPFYLWKWRDESVCRNDFKYILKTYNNMLDSSTALVEQFLKRNKLQDAQFYATMMVYDAYFTMNKKEWIEQENKQYRKNTELRFKDYYLKFRWLVENISDELKAQILQGLRNRFYAEGLLMETVTFNNWIEHVLKLEGDKTK